MLCGLVGDLEISSFKEVTGIFQPIEVILIWKIFSEEGSSALRSKQTSLQDRFEEEGYILQISLMKEVFQGGRINPLDSLFEGYQLIESFF